MVKVPLAYAVAYSTQPHVQSLNSSFEPSIELSMREGVGERERDWLPSPKGHPCDHLNMALFKYITQIQWLLTK